MPPFRRKLLGTAPARAQVIILVLDTPVDTVFEKHGTYADVFTEMFEKSMALQPRIEKGIEFLGYDCVQGEYPTDEELRNSAGVVMTGSAASAYEKIDWIVTLVNFIRTVPDRHPKCKIIGICFGHQIIAEAFGSKVIKCPDGWELGVRTIELTPLGERILAKNGEKTKTIEEVHQDHVTSLPGGFENLAFTPMCPFQGFVRFYAPPAFTASQRELYSNISIFSLQGHPEFTTDIVHDIIAVREARGILSKQFSDQSRADAQLPQEGPELGRVILEILNVD